jgi:2-phosphosulfolactate phosphatase
VTSLASSGVRDAHVMHQEAFTYRFDWGLDGLGALAPGTAVVVIVDVLRFTSAVSAAVEGGSVVLPFPWRGDGAEAYAREHGALLAGDREDGGPSLSPTDLLSLATGTRLVLPSPNGSALSFAARDLGASRVFAACLRNASAVARAARRAAAGAPIAVIAAGEHWGDATGPLRPAVEDLIGAGAVLAALDPSGAVGDPRCSPEAAAARATFLAARPRLFEALCASGSGRELLERGWEDDVAASAALDVTAVVPELIGDEFRAA